MAENSVKRLHLADPEGPKPVQVGPPAYRGDSGRVALMTHLALLDWGLTFTLSPEKMQPPKVNANDVDSSDAMDHARRKFLVEIE